MIDIKTFFKPVPETVFISGGMSGIGSVLAKAFGAAGSNIVILDCQDDESAMAEMRAVCVSKHQKIKSYAVDIRDPEKVCEAVNQGVSDVGRPNLAINSAGILRTAPFKEITYDTFKMVVDINLMGSRNFAAAVAPYMQAGDHLALIASLAGVCGTYTQAAYAASKFGVVGLAEVLRLELKQEGIDVSVICPGEIETPLLAHERKHGSQATKNLNAFAGVLSVDDACKGILKCLAKREFMITPGLKALFTRELSRKASTLFRKIADSKLGKELSRL
jgi:NAD(P)-dependent dehydrogenase (short-subunit alcohol dehydrogenase family)